MKNYKKFIIGILVSGITYGTYANVDQTNPFTFSYNCTASGGILNADFNLGGHHHYFRSYKIDKPGTIEIADSSHTTISKTTGISIDGCNYEPTSCNVSNWSNWSFVSNNTVTKEIQINTTLNVVKTGASLFIDGEGENEDIIITGFQKSYNGKGKKVYIDFLINEIVLKQNKNEGNSETEVIEKIDYTNTTYNGQKEYFYEFSTNNKDVKLKRNVFKRSGTGTVKTSENTYDVFSAYIGRNTGSDSSLLSDRMGKNEYSTGLDLWDYNQHNYTTTKVNLYPVTLNCNSTEFSNGTPSSLSFNSFTGSLGGIVEPIFSGDNLKINGYSPDSFGGFSIPASEKIDISGLEYTQVGKINGNLLGVDSIKISIKENDFTRSIITKNINPKKDTKGYFDNFTGLDLTGQQKITGNYQIIFSFFKGTQQLGSYEVPVLIHPNNLSQTNSSISLLATTTVNSKYANYSDYYEYSVTLKDDFGNLIKGIPLSSLNQDCSGISSCKSITTDMKNNLGNTGYDALIEDFYQGLATTSAGKLNFKLTSLAPGIYNEVFKLTINNWYNTGVSKSISLNNLNQTNSFKKLFTANLKLSNDNIGITKIIFGTSLKYLLDVTQISSGVSNYLIENFKDNVKASDEINYLATDISNPTDLNSDPRFSTTINTSLTATSILEDIGITISPKPVIKYTLGGKEISYKLTSSESDYTNSLPLVVENANEFLGVKVIGNLQGQGKQEITGQKSNFSDLSKQDIRTSIRKNAYSYIKTMKNNQVLNGVKYVNGDVTISGEQDYETLVVSNGNVIVDSNLNISNKKLGIIVLKDGYDSINGYKGKGNVYVKPSVTKLNAIIYADGGLIGVNSSGVPYDKEDSTRINDLKNQLVMNGTLFTRNTIGGAIYAGGNYKLPGDKVTSSFDTAVIYDLNYTRRGKTGCEKITPTSTTCKYDDGALVIIYNSTALTNPPKLFTK